nr:membrane protein m20 [Mastomys natalensis cytomegalovirus 3]WEG70273.1 membrane protein m20 [Mastomys natalensis cytomegalovirus 3]WEG70413.1 membrane protein m20 [Mastomys natalensis cytomegalovirus 3]WEG70553.1 membrane protein m20 [Mastomys natalensis cytomegalovirus 3]WEG70833.1 membrane protein m20 [Mastomys natalensis cytomegalovirus 3]
MRAMAPASWGCGRMVAIVLCLACLGVESSTADEYSTYSGDDEDFTSTSTAVTGVYVDTEDNASGSGDDTGLENDDAETITYTSTSSGSNIVDGAVSQTENQKNRTESSVSTGSTETSVSVNDIRETITSQTPIVSDVIVPTVNNNPVVTTELTANLRTDSNPCNDALVVCGFNFSAVNVSTLSSIWEGQHGMSEGIMTKAKVVETNNTFILSLQVYFPYDVFGWLNLSTQWGFEVGWYYDRLSALRELVPMSELYRRVPGGNLTQVTVNATANSSLVDDVPTVCVKERWATPLANGSGSARIFTTLRIANGSGVYPDDVQTIKCIVKLWHVGGENTATITVEHIVWPDGAVRNGSIYGFFGVPIWTYKETADWLSEDVAEKLGQLFMKIMGGLGKDLIEVAHNTQAKKDEDRKEKESKKHDVDLSGRGKVSVALKFFVGTVTSAGALAIIAGAVLLLAVGFKIMFQWWKTRHIRRLRRGMRRLEDMDEDGGMPVGLQMLMGARGPGGRNMPDGRRVPGAVGAIVPAAMAIGVAIAAILPFSCAAAQEDDKYWTGGYTGHDLGQTPSPQETCLQGDVYTSVGAAKQALARHGRVDSELEFRCPHIGDPCEIVCRFSGTGQLFDIVLNWASRRNRETKEIRREWKDHDCAIRRYCQIDRSAGKDGKGGVPKLVCGYSGTCRWQFGPRGNDLAGLYRCAVYYAPSFFDLPDGGTVTGQVAVEPGQIKELTLIATVAESNVVGCNTPSPEGVYVESVLVFPIVYYADGLFNWTYEAGLGKDGLPESLFAGGVQFNRTRLDIGRGVDGDERSYMRPPVDTVSGTAGGMLKFVFVARKSGVYHGLLLLDGLRRFSCVLTVPRDPCAAVRADQTGFAGAAAASELVFTTEGPQGVSGPAVGGKVDTAELYAKGIAVIVLSLALIAGVVTSAACIWKGSSIVGEWEKAGDADTDTDTIIEVVSEEIADDCVDEAPVEKT